MAPVLGAVRRAPPISRARRAPDAAGAGRWRSYAVPLGGTAVALAVGLILLPVAGGLPPLLFLAAVAVSGWYGGLGPALGASLLGALALDYFFETPRYALEVNDPATVWEVAGFLVVAALLGSLNARLRQARDQAEAAARAREELLAAVSHDLRTPLTAIKTSIAALRDRSDRAGDAAADARLLANAEAEADRLVRLVADALDLGRLEGGVAPAREWNAVGEIAAALLDRLAPVLGDRPIAFDVPDTLPLARFDAGLLEQALTNVLENVGVHTSPGTPVGVLGRIDDGLVRVEVSDGGPGIPVEERERVFAKFQRLSEDGFGTGLGLAIARAATVAQGGHMTVDESPLGGARFIIVIPTQTASGPAAV